MTEVDLPQRRSYYPAQLHTGTQMIKKLPSGRGSFPSCYSSKQLLKVGTKISVGVNCSIVYGQSGRLSFSHAHHFYS